MQGETADNASVVDEFRARYKKVKAQKEQERAEKKHAKNNREAGAK